MAQAIFNVFFTVIQTALNTILFPINALAETLLPDFSNMITTFDMLVNVYVGNTLSYFSSMLPPTTRSLLLIYLSFLITFYTVSFTTHGFIKIFTIIKRVKFW